MSRSYPGKVVFKSNMKARVREMEEEAKRRLTGFALELRRELREQLKKGAGPYPIHSDTGTAEMSWYIITASRNDYSLKVGYALGRYTKGSKKWVSAQAGWRPGAGANENRSGSRGSRAYNFAQMRKSKYQTQEYSSAHFKLRTFSEVATIPDSPGNFHAVVASFWKPLYYWEYGHRNWFIGRGKPVNVGSPFIRMVVMRMRKEMKYHFVRLDISNKRSADPFD